MKFVSINIPAVPGIIPGCPEPCILFVSLLGGATSMRDVFYVYFWQPTDTPSYQPALNGYVQLAQETRSGQTTCRY